MNPDLEKLLMNRKLVKAFLHTAQHTVKRRAQFRILIY